MERNEGDSIVDEGYYTVSVTYGRFCHTEGDRSVSQLPIVWKQRQRDGDEMTRKR